MVVTPSSLEEEMGSLVHGIEAVTDMVNRHIEKAERIKAGEEE